MKQVIIFILMLCCVNALADTVDNYQVYIKKVLILNDGGGLGVVGKGSLHYQIKEENYTDTFDVNFSHCTSGASKRRIQLLNSRNEIIKSWEFVDMQVLELMRIPIRQIKDVLVPGKEFTLYYFDDMLPGGRMMMMLQLEAILDPAKKKH